MIVLKKEESIGRASHAGIESSADEEHRVADRLGIEALPVGAPEPLVSGVFGIAVGSRIARLSIGRAGHDQAMKFF